MPVKALKNKDVKDMAKTHKAPLRPNRQNTNSSAVGSHFWYVLLELSKLPMLFIQLVFALVLLAIAVAVAIAVFSMVF